jgi:hypothetical protein
MHPSALLNHRSPPCASAQKWLRSRFIFLRSRRRFPAQPIYFPAQPIRVKKGQKKGSKKFDEFRPRFRG